MLEVETFFEFLKGFCVLELVLFADFFVFFPLFIVLIDKFQFGERELEGPLIEVSNVVFNVIFGFSSKEINSKLYSLSSSFLMIFLKTDAPISKSWQ